jgi:lipopolysaccharide export LptBFGC system permease protein LptF
MNSKYIVMVVVVSFFFSCKRNFVSTDRENVVIKKSSEITWKEGFVSSAEGPESFTTEMVNPLEKETFRHDNIKVIKKKIDIDSASAKDISRKELKRKIKDQQKLNKEMDPRLSRGLLMAIFGGIATTLGIVFMGYAPTGLFVFAFAIVFIIGMVNLIMYWANPKPKM